MALSSEVFHPNREALASQVVRLVMVVVLLGSAGLMVTVVVRGSDLIRSGSTVAIIVAVLDVLFAVQVLRWRRGVLPVAAGTAAFMAIFSGIAIGSWTRRDAFGYARPDLSSQVGTLVAVLFAVQVAIVAIAVVAFAQQWQIEQERDPTSHGHRDAVPA